MSQLNYGVLKVFEEMKQNLMLKNKGKYNMNFKFTILNHPKMFSITPMEGSISPNEKTLNISIGFKAESEVGDMTLTDDMTLTIRPQVEIKNSVEIVCHLVDPITNQLISKIPIHVNVRAVFSRYSVSPERGINFGPFIYGSKKSKQFTITNEGEFEFKYNLSRFVEGRPTTGEVSEGEGMEK